MAMGNGPIRRVEELQTPISNILDNFQVQLTELQKYKAKFGQLEEIVEDGSDTEQE